MPGPSADIATARAALEKARDELAAALASSSAWRALCQLSERSAAGDPLVSLPEEQVRARLEARLDETVPGWRGYAGLAAAIDALGPIAGDTLPPLESRPAANPATAPAATAAIWRPLPTTSDAPGAEATHSRPMPAPDERTDVLSRIRLIETPATPRGTAPSPTAPSPEGAATSPPLSRTPAAGIEHDAARRIEALEVVIDALRSGMPGTAHVRPTLVPPADMEPDYARFEEAEVEILTALPSEPPSPWPSPAASPMPDATSATSAAPFSLETFFEEEAEVEIIVAEPAAKPGDAARPSDGD